MQQEEEQNKTCAICGAQCIFNYYDVPSCEACKQFFRRTVLNQRFFHCPNDANCDISAAHKCRGCRLNKCLIVGMKAQMVRAMGFAIPKEYFDALEEHKLLLLMSRNRQQLVAAATADQIHPLMDDDDDDQSKSIGGDQPNNNNCAVVKIEQFTTFDPSSPINSSMISTTNCKTMETFATLRQMSALHVRYEEFFSTLRVFRDDFVTRFGSARELIEFRTSILSNTDKFTVPPSPIDESAQNCGPHIMKMDMFLLPDLFWSIPVFLLISLDDQVRLFNYIGVILGSFCTKFRSIMANSTTQLKLPTNLVPLYSIQQHPIYGKDLTIQKISVQLFHKFMEPFCRVKLCQEEFLLLRAIMICHSGVPNLSPHAQKLLQSEAERYAGILMHFLQLKHGNAQGALRYAQVLQVLECMFQSKGKHHEFLTYLAMVVQQQYYYDTVPPAFIPMQLNGCE